ncbi:MAG: sulfotransferase domain-containing protein [Rhizomicrobium sp.]
MSDIVWLASYPKSGSTWLRLLIENLVSKSEKPADINRLSALVSHASSARDAFDSITGVDTDLLQPGEVEFLRGGVYRLVAQGRFDDIFRPAPIGSGRPLVFMKVHDAYARSADGTPLFGAGGAAIVIVRDPRAIVPSFAGHFGYSKDAAVQHLASDDFVMGAERTGPQLRQQVLSWSRHVQSWLDQADVPVFLLRYEDMRADAARALRDAMSFLGIAVDEDAARRAAGFADFNLLQAQERAAGFRERLRRATAPFFRRGDAAGWRDELSAEQIAKIERAHGPTMQRLGYGDFAQNRPDGGPGNADRYFSHPLRQGDRHA